jgi:probable rRNA maturation factor
VTPGADTDGAMVVVSDERSEHDSPELLVDVDRWQRLAIAVLLAEGAVGELTLTFLDRVDIADLNAEHMGKSGATDVLSFPMDDEPQQGVPTLLGDVVVSPAVAGEQYHEHAGTYDDEVALLVVHGILHILGHDHAEPEATARMRRRELELLNSHHWGGVQPERFRQRHDD